MNSDASISMTDPEGIALVVGVAVLYLLIRLLPRLIVGFGSFVPAAEVKRRMESNEPLLLLDVRSRQEFENELGHVRQAVNVPLGELSHWLDGEAGSVSRAQVVIAICRTEARAALAVRKLHRAGFQDVRVMSGGMTGWLAEDFPVEHGPA